VYRVLKEHGRLVILEFAPPKRKIKRFLWFFVLGHMVLVNIDKLLAPVREGGFKEIECSDTPWEVLTLVKCSK
jgi:ubiquinone/menaquinone biosynthesis C-methylase UbiE